MDMVNEEDTDIYKCLWMDHGSWMVNRGKFFWYTFFT